MKHAIVIIEVPTASQPEFKGGKPPKLKDVLRIVRLRWYLVTLKMTTTFMIYQLIQKK